MKKRLSVILTVCLLIQTFALFAVSVSGEEPEAFSDHLVVHFDFEGEDQDARLSDKAPAGKSKENLTTLQGKASVSDGCLQLPAGSAASTTLLGDIVGITGGKMTVFLRFKADYLLHSAQWADLFRITNTVRFAVNDTTGAFNAVTDGGGSTGAMADIDDENDDFAGSWLYLAVALNESTKKTAIFYSINDGTTWGSANGTMKDSASIAAASALTIGLGVARGLSLLVDDFRVYDTALTLDDLKEIVPASSEPGTEAEKDEDTSILLHYNFAGTTVGERLANRGNSNAEPLLLAGSASEVKENMAYISSASGNYLSASMDKTVKNVGSDSTVFTVFRATGDAPSNAGDILQLTGTVRVALDVSNKIFTRVGEGITTSGDTQKSVGTVNRDAWIYLAVTLHVDDSDTVTETVFISSDEGKTYSSVQFVIDNVPGMFLDANELLLGKVNKTIADRGTSFYYRDVRLYNRILTQEELQQIEINELSADVKPEEPDVPEDRDIAEYLVIHYDFLGDTEEEMLRDKAKKGKSDESLMIYSSLDENGNKLTYLGHDGTAYVDMAQNNLLFAMVGEDITEATEMTVFVNFMALGDQPTNPVAIAAFENLLRFSFHNQNSIFGKVGTNFGYGSLSSTANQPRDMWIKAAITLKWNPEKKSVVMRLYVSLNGGKSYAPYSGSATDVLGMFGDCRYLCLGKLSPGMEARGTAFRYKDVRVYNVALTEAELSKIIVVEYEPKEDPETEPTHDEPGTSEPTETTEVPTGNGGESEKPGTGSGCQSAAGSAGMLLALLVPFSFLLAKGRRKNQKRT